MPTYNYVRQMMEDCGLRTRTDESKDSARRQSEEATLVQKFIDELAGLGGGRVDPVTGNVEQVPNLDPRFLFNADETML